MESDMKVNNVNDFFTKTLKQEMTNELHFDLQKYIIYTGINFQNTLLGTQYYKTARCIAYYRASTDKRYTFRILDDEVNNMIIFIIQGGCNDITPIKISGLKSLTHYSLLFTDLSTKRNTLIHMQHLRCLFGSYLLRLAVIGVSILTVFHFLAFPVLYLYTSIILTAFLQRFAVQFE